jgi:hypothetical protein
MMMSPFGTSLLIPLSLTPFMCYLAPHCHDGAQHVCFWPFFFFPTLS